MNTDTRGAGDNKPANPLQVYLDDLAYAVEDPLKELTRLIEAQGPRIPEKFETVEHCKKGITLAIMLGDLIDTVEVLVKNHKKPLADMVKLITTNGEAWVMLGEDFRQQIRGKIDAFMDTMQPGEQVRTEYGELASRREVYKFELLDADQVPAALQTPDADLIKMWIAGKTKGVTNAEAIVAILAAMKNEVPGIRVYREPILMLTQGGKT